MTEYEAATKVCNWLMHLGYRAAFAGGCVRDMVLGRRPTDIDIVTDALPDEIEASFPNTIPVGKEFGVIIVQCEGYSFEVATLRTDGEYSDSRRPDSVEFTNDFQLDAGRRDFTMNSLFYVPSSGLTLDYFDGRKDIDERKIRCVGNALDRFKEDGLRVMRAARFSSQLGFHIDTDTLRVMGHPSAKAALSKCSGERIQMELVKLLDGHNTSFGLRALDHTQTLDVILPEVANLRYVPEDFHTHGGNDTLEHTYYVLDKAPHTVRLAALLHDIGKAEDRKKHASIGARMAEEILRRLKFDKETIKRTVWIIENHMRLYDFFGMREAKQKRFMQSRWFVDLCHLSMADDHGDTAQRVFDHYMNLGSEDILPDPIITGHTLKNFGYTPGPKFGVVLDAVYDAQLEGKVQSYDEACDMATELLGDRQ